MKKIKYRVWDKQQKCYLSEDNSEYEDPIALSPNGNILIKRDNGACGDPECCGDYLEYYSKHETGDHYIIKWFIGDQEVDILEDKERLDRLEEIKQGYGKGWVVRWSTTNRGLRIHESSRDDALPTIREAIDDFLNKNTNSKK